MTSESKQPNRKSRRMPVINKNSKKNDGFAIGVNTSHYWMITALAEGKRSNRMAVLEEVIDYYIQNKLTGTQ